MIGRYVFRTQINGLLQVRPPGIQGFTRKTIHQIDADILKTCFPTSSKSFDGLNSRMPTMKQLQGLFLKGLNPHADAVDGQLTKHGHILWGQVVRISFESYLGIFFDGIYLIYMIKYLLQFFS